MFFSEVDEDLFNPEKTKFFSGVDEDSFNIDVINFYFI